MRKIMTNNSRIKFLIITALTIILILFTIIVFQLVKIFQYNSRLNKLEDEVEKNKNIITYYERLLDENSSDNTPDNQ